MFTPFETARLVLRPWHPDDLEELERLFADPAVRKGRHLPPERIIAIAQSSLRQWQRNGFGPWAAIEKPTGQ
jgi:RimJ/RimL family protein N-acetyltransferase